MNAPSTTASPSTASTRATPAVRRPARRQGVASWASVMLWLLTLGAGGLAGFQLGLQAGSPLVAMLSSISGALFCSILADALWRRLRRPAH